MCSNGFIFFNEVIVLRNMFVSNAMVLNLFLSWPIFVVQNFCDPLTFYVSKKLQNRFKNKTKLRSSKTYFKTDYLFNRALVRYLLLNIINLYKSFWRG